MTEKRSKQCPTVTDAELRKRLTEQQYYVTQQKGTESAFNNKYWNTKKDGTYHCICCGQELFSSKTKYDSGTGWPSFWEPISKDAVTTQPDTSLEKVRTEVLCGKCGAHLGHVFDDGQPPSHLRYCINSSSLNLVERKNR